MILAFVIFNSIQMGWTFTINKHDVWFKNRLTEYPSLRYDISISVTFQNEVCCPVMNIITDSLNRTDYLKAKYFDNELCIPEDILTKFSIWSTPSMFVLSNNPHSGKCHLHKDQYICNIKTTILYYEPKLLWITFAYKCNETKDIYGLKYQHSVRQQNTTACEPIQVPKPKLTGFRCDTFSKLVTFPNPFGRASQTEALQMFQTVQTALKITDEPCHQHLDYVLCQILFPICHPETVENNTSASQVMVICEETCNEVVKACSSEVGLLLANPIDCTYYRRNSPNNTNCVNLPVTCDKNPTLKNGKSSFKNNTSYKVGSSITFTCNNGYKLRGNSTSYCQYSGTWTQPPICTSLLHIYLSIAGVIFLGIISVVLISTVRYRKRKKAQKKIQDFFELQPLQKRNREFDAFVSYTYLASIDFAKEFERKLEPEFKLFFHTRNFHGATLILQNIVDGINKSNCAIVLMSQEYIDSAWCREEFQMFIEEGRGDPAYKVFMILMQPKETLKRYNIYVDKYFKRKTYLVHDDPDLWQKLTQYLKELQ